MTDRADELIRLYSLEPLPGEGGYFRFISSFGNGAGSIYYLITDDEWSHLHMLGSDELWFFLEGDGAEQIAMGRDGKVRRTVLSSLSRCSVVRKGEWQATRLSEKGGYALFSTVMSPAYRDEDYHAPSCGLLAEHPELEEYACRGRY